MRAYEGTTVTVARSQGEIGTMLRGYGARSFSFEQDDDRVGLGFFRGGLAVRMRVPLQPLTEEASRAGAKQMKVSRAKAVADRFEREERRVWRVLYWLLKGRMEAIESGVETFEQAFLAHLLDAASDRTVYEAMVEQGALRQLGAGT